MPRACITVRHRTDESAAVWGHNLFRSDEGLYFTELGFEGRPSEHAVIRVRELGGRKEVLWHGPSGILGAGMAVDDRVYFTSQLSRDGANQNALVSVPVIAGGPMEVLATLPSPCAPYSGVALDDHHVYAGTLNCVAGPSTLTRALRTGGGASTIWSSDTKEIGWIAAYEDAIYFTVEAAREVDLLRVRSDETGATRVASVEEPPGWHTESLALYRSTAYLLTKEHVVAIPLDEPIPQTVAEVSAPIAIAVDDSGVYVSLAGTRNAPHSIVRVAPFEPPVTMAEMRADLPFGAAQLELDANSVYWATLGQLGEVGKCND